MLAIMNSEDELAAVLGHEIGHVAGRHSAKQQTKSRGWIPLQVLAGIGGAAASVVSPELGSTVAGMAQLPASLALASYSRKQEKEADRLGQQYAAAEGWDPAALSATMDALTREQELAGGRDPNQMSFFDSHPTTPERAREGREYAATLTAAPADRIAIDRNSFVQRLDGLVIGDSAKGGVFIDDRFVHPELDFTLSFPAGWEHDNGPNAVLAVPKDESAIVALQLAAEGDDPAAVADEVAKQVELTERIPRQINGLPAVSAIARMVDQGQEIVFSLTWIAKNDLIYQVLGATTPDQWSKHRPTFEATAAGFRKPSETELRKVYEDRLRLAAAKDGETLGAVIERVASQWSAKRAAAANAMEPSDSLQRGELVKVSKREPYR
jgi:predicted Zn-dependent protease